MDALRTTLALLAALSSAPVDAEEKPNFVLIFADDLGYGDLGCYGNEVIRTPSIDRMAREGIRFESFYSQTVCGPSRAALMTGCYPLRVAKRGNRMDIHPMLHTEEVTVAEVLRGAGYATGCIGKWDLAGHSQTGYDPRLLPLHQGFDSFFGTPSSNDSVVHLLRQDEVVEKKADMSTLTKRYTEEAVAFLSEHAEEPFFLYVAHTMPHTRLSASEAFRGKSERGLYGDVIEEIDWSVGQILSALRELDLEDRTYVAFLSDNGPWWIKKERGGSAGPLRGAKTSVWEGGVRVPCVVRAPGRIPPGLVSDHIATTLDWLPTLAALAGATPPEDRVIDGHDIRALLHGDEGATSPTEAVLHYVHTHLQAVRQGRWKLHLPRPAEPTWTPNWAHHISPDDVFEIATPLLFDLESDVGETRDVAEGHPQVVRDLLQVADRARADIGDYDRVGENARFFDDEPRRPDIER